MSDNNPYKVLFEPVQIGPVKTRNRFYQVPHCTGMGYRYPRAEAAHRGVKAEGGWGVVSTQEVEIHPTSDLTPFNEGRLWDDGDIPALAMMADAVHAHGSLAALQLAHNGSHAMNRYSRVPPLAPSALPVDSDDPIQARAMDKADIKEFRKWHVDAAKRAKRAGFDIIYVYAGHDMTLLQHFLLARHNHRSDEYGGSFENRLRLFREVLADTKDAVGDTCAIAVRLAVDELMGEDGLRFDVEGRDIITALAEEPDLWDVNLSDWSNDSQSSRFAKEGYQESYTSFVKSVTSKPVVGVGRYTNPDTMVRLVKQGHLDLIGAARPSIADPFLPNKIAEGRSEDIRECIGCNVCISGDNTAVPMRCTQNPSVGEEWRRNWHPEIGQKAKTANRFLVVGGGPAGLEAARGLASAGHEVTLAEGSNLWGGRVEAESRLPGLAEWARVRDWRLGQLTKMANVEMYLESELGAADILEHDAQHVVLATGAQWRSDGIGRSLRRAIDTTGGVEVLGVEDVLRTGVPQGRDPIVLFDDDRFYLGSVLAEACVKAGREVVFVTPSSVVAPWTDHTLEQSRIQVRLMELGVEILPLNSIEVTDGTIHAKCVYSGKLRALSSQTLLPVTARLPRETLWDSLGEKSQEWNDAGIETVRRIGDCNVPGLIAGAVQSGFSYACENGLASTGTVLREDAQMVDFN